MKLMKWFICVSLIVSCSELSGQFIINNNGAFVVRASQQAPQKQVEEPVVPVVETEDEVVVSEPALFTPDLLTEPSVTESPVTVQPEVKSDVERVREAIAAYTRNPGAKKAWVVRVGNYDASQTIGHITSPEEAGHHGYASRSFLQQFTPQELVWIHSMCHYAPGSLPELGLTQPVTKTVSKPVEETATEQKASYAVTQRGNRFYWVVGGTTWNSPVVSEGTTLRQRRWTYRNGRMHDNTSPMTTVTKSDGQHWKLRTFQQCTSGGCRTYQKYVLVP